MRHPTFQKAVGAAASLTAVCAVFLMQSAANAQIIGPGGFTGAATVDDFTGLGLPFNNSGTLTRPYGTYSFTANTYRYGDFSAGNSFGEAIGTDNDADTIDLLLNTPVLRAGGYIGGSDANVSFFDAGNNLLTTAFVDFTGTPTFIGFQSDSGIARISFTDAQAQNGTILILDRTTLEGSVGGAGAAPEPGTFALLIGGLLPVAGIVAARRRRGRKA